jgi:hypothetical protein
MTVRWSKATAVSLTAHDSAYQSTFRPDGALAQSATLPCYRYVVPTGLIRRRCLLASESMPPGIPSKGLVPQCFSAGVAPDAIGRRGVL